MSNYGEYTIIYFEEDLLQIKELLEIFLNIIFFHRYLSSKYFEDVQSKLNNISYVKIKNEKLSKDLINNINEIENNFKHNLNQYAQRLTLRFYEKENIKKEVNNPWEIWNFILILAKKEENKELNNKKEEVEDDRENKIRKFIFKIIEKLNDKNNYMPNINLNENSLSEEAFTYDFQIENISTKEDYLTLFNLLVKKNQENVIIIDHLS